MHMTMQQETERDVILDLCAIRDDIRSALNACDKALKDHDKYAAIEQLRRILFLTEDFQ